MAEKKNRIRRMEGYDGEEITKDQLEQSLKQMIRVLGEPQPRFVVFYNGLEKMPDKIELKLSDAYEKRNEDPALELKIQVVNINKGYNEKLMKNSPTLYEYMMFVECVRKYQKQYEFEFALEKAIDECIEKGILRDFLKKNRAEGLRMWLFEYDQEKHLKQERNEAETRGEVSKLISIIIKKMKKNQSPEEIATILEEDLNTVLHIYNIAKQYAPGYDLEKITAQYLNEKHS